MQGREDAPGDDVALDLREPELHLVEPGGVGRREVQLHIRMGLQEGVDVFGLMRGEIVEDDVDRDVTPLMGHDVGQEGDELGRRVPFGGASEHLAGARIERGVERKRPVAEVLKAVAFGAPGRQRQHRIQAIERLDCCLLIDTEDGSMLRRVQVEPDDVGGLAFERRVIGGHIALESMRLQAVPRPDAGDHHMRDTEGRAQPSRAPVRRAVLGPAACQVKNPGFELRREHRRRLPTVPTVEPGQALGRKACTPARDIAVVAAHLRPNPRPPRARSEQQQTAGASGFIGSAFATAHTTFQFLPFHGG